MNEETLARALSQLLCATLDNEDVYNAIEDGDELAGSLRSTSSYAEAGMMTRDAGCARGARVD